jgi:hypothetical protein
MPFSPFIFNGVPTVKRIQLCTEFRTWLFAGSTFCKMTCCFRGYLRVLTIAFQGGKHIKIMFFYFLKIILDIIISNPKI